MCRMLAHAAAGSLLVLCWGCTNTDHDALAARDAGPEEAALVDQQLDAPDDQQAEAGAPDAFEDGDVPDAEPEASVEAGPGLQPDGPSVLTFVHGVVDAAHLRVCFWSREEGQELAPHPVAPWPNRAQGLEYASSLSTATLEDIDLESEDVQPVLYVGDLAALGTISCADLAQPPEGVSAYALQVLPAGTLSKQRHVVAVAAGCVGGAGHEDSVQELVCGAGYGPSAPTVRLLVASVDRLVQEGAIGMQAMGGSVASPALTLQHWAPSPGTVVQVASRVAAGMVAPRPPSFVLNHAQLGAMSENELMLSEGSGEPVRLKLADALDAGGVRAEHFVEGRSFVTIWVGPRVGMGVGTWWMPFSALVIAADPAS